MTVDRSFNTVICVLSHTKLIISNQTCPCSTFETSLNNKYRNTKKENLFNLITLANTQKYKCTITYEC